MGYWLRMFIDGNICRTAHAQDGRLRGMVIGMHRRRIVVVEDDAMTRGLLADLLESAGFDVATTGTAADARRVVAMVDPDGVVLDVDLGPGPTGFDLADALLHAYPHLGVLFLTHLPDSRFAGRSASTIPAGAAYIRKDQLSRPGVLREALDAALRGTAEAEHRHDLQKDRPFAHLSRTQISVLRMVALGMSNQQIAETRGTTVRAVYALIDRTMDALGIEVVGEGHSRVEAARAYMLAAGIPLA